MVYSNHHGQVAEYKTHIFHNTCTWHSNSYPNLLEYLEIYTSDSISPAETEGSSSGKSSRNPISDEESMYLHIEQVCSEEED